MKVKGHVHGVSSPIPLLFQFGGLNSGFHSRHLYLLNHITSPVSFSFCAINTPIHPSPAHICLLLRYFHHLSPLSSQFRSVHKPHGEFCRLRSANGKAQNSNPITSFYSSPKDNTSPILSIFLATLSLPLSTAPSTVPIMHQVSATMRSITLSWPQPEQPNGIILDYEIRYYEKVSHL